MREETASWLSFKKLQGNKLLILLKCQIDVGRLS